MTRWCQRELSLAAVALLAACISGCAGGPPSAEALAANDPFETSNRQTLELNGKIDHYLLNPVVGAYHRIMPTRGGGAVHNFIQNIALPTVFINDLLQGETRRAGQTLARFAINTTLGLGGLFDPATSKFHIPAHDEDFGQTLGVWGVGEGPYLVLPLFGPQPPRDAFGQIVYVFLNPLNQIHFKQHLWWEAGRYTSELLDLRGQTYSSVQGIQRSSVDYYAALRSMYRQMRDNEIRNGRPDPPTLPEF